MLRTDLEIQSHQWPQMEKAQGPVGLHNVLDNGTATDTAQDANGEE